MVPSDSNVHADLYLAQNAPPDRLLDVRNMRVWYATVAGAAKVVDGVTLSVRPNEIFGIAGESGCGKSTLVEGVLRLIKPPGYLESGQALFRTANADTAPDGANADTARDGVDLLALTDEQMRRLRWKAIAYVPQGAMNSLNPVLRVQDQIVDAMRAHSDVSKPVARERVHELLTMVGLSAETARMYPHELSGGMKQRVTIAASVALNPALLVADEPTTALDVTVQRIILQALRLVRAELGLTIVYVSHDMASHAELADRMAIMYAGKVVEIGPTAAIFYEPLHPYTIGLIESIPDIHKPRRRLAGIPGQAPSPLRWPQGCRFHPRCPHVMDRCRAEVPRLQQIAPERFAACFLHSAAAEGDGASAVPVSVHAATQGGDHAGHADS